MASAPESAPPPPPPLTVPCSGRSLPPGRFRRRPAGRCATMLQLLWFLPSYEPQSLEASTYLLWYALYAGLFALFYVFSSPFTGNRSVHTAAVRQSREQRRGVVHSVRRVRSRCADTCTCRCALH